VGDFPPYGHNGKISKGFMFGRLPQGAKVLWRRRIRGHNDPVAGAGLDGFQDIIRFLGIV